MDLSKAIQIYGSAEEHVLPSGNLVIIREQNGEDDALLSNVSMTKNFEALNSFIVAVTVHLSCSKNPEKPPLIEEIMRLPLNDKYFILIASRIFSLGPKLIFEYPWDQDNPPAKYEEDLNQYIWDYTKPFPEPGMPGYFPERIRPYTGASFVELKLSSGKEFKYNFLDSYGEKYLLKLPQTDKHINQQILARDPQLKIDGVYQKVTSFAKFSSKDMAEIRKSISEMDPEFNGLTTLENPYQAGEVEKLSIIQIPDFFFPREI